MSPPSRGRGLKLAAAVVAVAGYAVAAAGDVNADGFPDVLIGAPDNDDGPGTDPGAAYLVLGTASPYSSALSSAAAEYTGEVADDHAGYHVAGAGDYDADGFADILIGAPDNDDGPGDEAGAAYLVLGSPGPTSLGLASADAEYIGEDQNDLGGYDVAGVGDANGDGYDDFVTSAAYNDTGGTDAGAVYLFLGGPRTASASFAAGVKFTGQAGDVAGDSLSGAGDTNADGYDDFLVGADQNGDGPGTESGAGYLVRGSASPAPLSLDGSAREYTGEADGDRAGARVSGAGDVNADGFADLLVNAPLNDAAGTDAGAIYLLFQ